MFENVLQENNVSIFFFLNVTFCLICRCIWNKTCSAFWDSLSLHMESLYPMGVMSKHESDTMIMHFYLHEMHVRLSVHVSQCACVNACYWRLSPHSWRGNTTVMHYFLPDSSKYARAWMFYSCSATWRHLTEEL